MAESLSDIKETLNEFEDLEDGFEIFEEDIFKHYETAYTDLLSNIELKKSLQKIEFFIPQNKEIINNNIVYFKGKIYPEQPFKINNTYINPNILGEFNITKNIEYGKNNFYIETEFTSKNISIFQIPEFDDLSEHWINNTASKLKYLNLIDHNKTFNPNTNISQIELVNYIFNFWNIDIDLNNSDYSNTSLNNYVLTVPNPSENIAILEPVSENITISSNKLIQLSQLAKKQYNYLLAQTL